MKLLDKIIIKSEKLPIINKLLTDKHFRTIASTGFSTCINLAYVCYNGFLGIAKRSVWFFTMFVYYAIIGAMRGAAVIHSRKGKREKDNTIMLADGILLLFLTVVLTGIILLSLKYKLMKNYGRVPMIALTTYTFYKVITSCINLGKDKRNKSPIIRTIRDINFADAAVSLISTQMSMYATFGDPDEGHDMTVITGAVICGLMCLLAIAMLVKAKRKE